MSERERKWGRESNRSRSLYVFNLMSITCSVKFDRSKTKDYEVTTARVTWNIDRNVYGRRWLMISYLFLKFNYLIVLFCFSCSGYWRSCCGSIVRHSGGHVHCLSHEKKGWRFLCPGWAKTITCYEFLCEKCNKSRIFCLRKWKAFLKKTKQQQKYKENKNKPQTITTFFME